jgi:hypothetical protein
MKKPHPTPLQRNIAARRAALGQFERAIGECYESLAEGMQPTPRQYARREFARGVLLQALGV